MSQCGSCGSENSDRDRFCGECGAALALACRSCGEPYRAGRRFCGQCGAALSDETASVDAASGEPAVPPTAVDTGVVDTGGAGESASAGRTVTPDRISTIGRAVASRAVATEPVSERRVCAVLFADLVGFTVMAESKDPEDVREALSHYFEVCRSVIGRYGGVVEKFIGDAVMAVWGSPKATEQDAERAVRAALELVDAVEALGGELGATLLARAGIVTGEVAVTLGARGEGMVAGDAVNTASRIQSLAPPGAVFVDVATAKLADSAIAFEDEGSHELKGKAVAEHLLRAVRVLSGVGGAQRSDGLEAPLTGREPEFRALKELFHSCVDRRSPRLVVVEGPAGVGKSRLGWEFEKYTDGLADTVLWHRGRCLSYGEGVAFWALAEIVRQRFGIAEEDPTGVAEARLAEGLVRFVADPVERGYIGVRLSRLLGVVYPAEAPGASDPELTQDELYSGWRLFFERLAEVAPVTLLVENAHLADDGLLGFFAHLLDWTRNLPIFVLLFARPGRDAIDAGYGVGRNRSTLSLDPLDDASMRALIEALVPGMPAAVCRSITEKAEGLPLFAVETIRSLVDRGVVVRGQDGGFELSGEPGELSVPRSLRSLLTARLDALPPDARRITSAACVLGSSFSKETLAAVTGAAAGTVAEALQELVRRDVLAISADPLSPERGSYRFLQEMLRQVAYDTLSKRDRKSLHLAVAASLRAAFANDGEEIAEVIARHYLDARAASPAAEDAGALVAEALSFLRRAAERADRAGAPARAAEIYAEAAGIAPAEDAPALRERSAYAWYSHGDFDSALALAGRALEGHRAAGDERGAARVRSFQGRVLWFVDRTPQAREALTEAVGVLRAEPDEDTVSAIRRLAMLELFAGNLEEAERLLAEALELAQSIGIDDTEVARLFDSKGHAALFANRLIEAAVYYEAAAAAAERAGNVASLLAIQHNLSDFLARTDPSRAAEVARSAAEHARRTGRRPGLGLATANLAVALIELGEWDEAERELTSAIEVDEVDDPDVHRLVGCLAGLRGDAVGTAAALDRLGASRGSDLPQTRASVGFLEALAAYARGEREEALAVALEVLELRQQIGIGHESQRWGWPLAARIARSLGDASSVRRLLEVLDPYPAGHLPPVLRAERQLVAALREADDGDPAALAAVAEAVAALRRLRNPYQLAHALVDQGELLAAAHDPGADAAFEEALDIATTLRSGVLLERVRSADSDSVRA